MSAVVTRVEACTAPLISYCPPEWSESVPTIFQVRDRKPSRRTCALRPFPGNAIRASWLALEMVRRQPAELGWRSSVLGATSRTAPHSHRQPPVAQPAHLHSMRPGPRLFRRCRPEAPSPVRAVYRGPGVARMLSAARKSAAARRLSCVVNVALRWPIGAPPPVT